MRLILGSTSPARLATLRAAGVSPEVIDPGVDESRISAVSAAALTAELALLKGEAVVSKVRADTTERTVVISCDSMLEIEGKVYGKPGTAGAAVVRWLRMRGRQGVLHTGHYVAVFEPDGSFVHQVRVASTVVTFADLTDAEISAYAATGEPAKVAGAFTIDGYGGPFVTRIEGDPHNVVGISLPLVRQMLLDMGVEWPTLWEKRP